MGMYQPDFNDTGELSHSKARVVGMRGRTRTKPKARNISKILNFLRIHGGNGFSFLLQVTSKCQVKTL